MRDGSAAIGIHADELRLANDVIAEIGAEECVPEWGDGLLHGRFKETVAKMRAYAQFSAAVRTVRDPICPGQREEIALDFKAEIDGVECWFESAMLDNELWWLSDNDRSTMFHSTGGIGISAWRILARNLVAAASRRVGRLEGWGAQTVMIVNDPLGEIGHCGGLDRALEKLGRACPQLGALIVVKRDRYTIHKIAGSANPLSAGVRAGILRINEEYLAKRNGAADRRVPTLAGSDKGKTAPDRAR